MNNVALVGRLAKDPDLKYTPTGQAVCTFPLAVDNPFNKDGQADFINIVVWAKKAENVANYCTKGKQVFVVGRIQTRNYEAQDGRKVYVTEVVANDVGFLAGNPNREQKTNLMDNAKVTEIDDSPFE